MRTIAFSIVALAFSTAANAAVTWDSSSVPTTDLPGFSTWTVTFTSDDPIVGFDFAGDGSDDPQTGSGFFGQMNQRDAFGGFLHPLWLNEAAATNDDILAAQDSHFLVLNNNTSQGGRADAQIVNANQSDVLLQAAYAVPLDANLGTQVDLVQLIIPDAALGEVAFNGTIIVNNGSANSDVPVSGIVGGVPEPTTFALLGLAFAGFAGFRRR